VGFATVATVVTVVRGDTAPIASARHPREWPRLISPLNGGLPGGSLTSDHVHRHADHLSVDSAGHSRGTWTHTGIRMPVPPGLTDEPAL